MSRLLGDHDLGPVGGALGWSRQRLMRLRFGAGRAGGAHAGLRAREPPSCVVATRAFGAGLGERAIRIRRAAHRGEGAARAIAVGRARSQERLGAIEIRAQATKLRAMCRGVWRRVPGLGWRCELRAVRCAVVVFLGDRSRFVVGWCFGGVSASFSLLRRSGRLRFFRARAREPGQSHSNRDRGGCRCAARSRSVRAHGPPSFRPPSPA